MEALVKCSKCGTDRDPTRRCKPCAAAYQRAYRSEPQVRARSLAYQKQYRAEHPEQVSAAIRKCQLSTRYECTPEQYDTMFANQGGRCAICKTDKPGNKRFNIDHDHVTGKVRGLLCGSCNRGIGQLNDDPWMLFNAATYLWNQA